MKKFRLAKTADSDMRKIAEYTKEQWGVKQRDIYIEEMFITFSQLANAPQMGTKIDNIRKGYRKFPQGSHIIFFREATNIYNIEIIRILHNRMDVDTHLNSP